MPLDSKLRDKLRERRKKVFAAGGEQKINERHERGLLSARERLHTLFQPDTFQ
ncbi:MAG: acyl-CoA carboxylase subunit beta, partial [Rhodospirillales bacterium]|nr:acyl-CoA carboxylase subunit beta [Rhodospirillales bacterium]